MLKAEMKSEARAASLTADLTRLKEDIQRVCAGPATGGNRFGGSVPTAELKGLRIRIRTFLDQYRLALPREEALELRRMMQELDQAIAVLPNPSGR
jgi:hypothetical protein